MIRRNDTRGVTIVEALVGTSILAVALVFISVTITLVASTAGDTVDRLRAVYLAEEGHELVRHLRDEDWTTEIAARTIGTAYYVAVATSTIDLSTTPDLIDGTFTRSVTFSQARRDANDDLIASGGANDTDARRVTVTVTWGSESFSSESLISNVHNI